jgi:hypothetical protein
MVLVERWALIRDGSMKCQSFKKQNEKYEE